MSKQKVNNEILVKLDDLKEVYHSKNNQKWLKIAVERKIIPLKVSPELAQICGHLIGDGYLRLTRREGGRIKFFGNLQKLKDISRIYKRLFNKEMELVERIRENNYGYNGGYKLETTDSIVTRCLYKIGVPSGDKITTEFEVPYWIFNSNNIEIKRRFIQALFDDELEGLYKDKTRPNTWKGLRILMSKWERFVNSSLKFFSQIRFILEQDFGIETTELKVYDNVKYKRQDGRKTLRVGLRIRNNLQNRIKFYKEIGFIYDEVKQKRLISSLN